MKDSAEGKKNIMKKLSGLKTQWTIFYLENLYKFHIHIRYAHDKVYERGGVYKQYSDSKISGQVHKASIYAFVFSFVAFTFMQSVWPYFFTLKPREVTASQSSVSWTSYDDFNNNNSATGTTTQSQATINGSGAPTDATVGTVQLAGTTVDTGSGADGALTVNSGGTSTLAVTKTSVSTTSSSGQNILTVSATTGFSVNDKVLVIQMTGTGIGNQEEATVSAILASPARLQLSSNLTYTYTNDASSKPQVLKVNQYTNITVTNNTTWTVAAWDGSTGGILPIKASGTVQIDAGSKIDLTGKGFAGGQGPGAGYSASYSSNNGGGSGGGGGYGGGGAGGGGQNGAGGPAYNVFLALGSGGGSSSTDEYSGVPYTGGAGGGAIKIEANSYIINGNVFSKGGNQLNNGDSVYNVAGGGSGGSIYLLSNTAVTNAGNVSATGAGGGLAGNSASNGAGGGRIKIKAPSITGTPVVSGYGSGGTGVYPQSTPDYATPGTVGGATATNVGLRLDAGSGQMAKAATLTWNATTGVSGQKVLFKVRSGDTQAELDSSACYGPSTSEVNPCSDWTTAGKFFSQINGASNSSTTVLDTIASKRYIEVLVRLESSGADTPTLSDVTLTYDNVEAPELASTSISTASNGTISTGGTEGTYTKDTTVNITTTGLTCTNCGTSTQRQIEVEVKPVATAFDGTGLVQGDYNDTTFASTATISGLSAGTSYHSRLRTIDAQGRVSGWTSYGSGSDTPTAAADFSIDQSPPTVGSFTINSGATYASASTRIITANGIFNDAGGSSGTLQVQFSEDGTNWGKYSGSGTTNNKTTDWTDYATVTASGISQDIANAWYLEGTDGPKTIYARTKDAAGNVIGVNFTSQNDWNGTTQGAATTLSNIELASPSGDVKLTSPGSAVDVGSGTEGNYTLSTTKTIKDIYEVDLGKGAGTYNPSTGAVPNFNNLTITGTGILTTTAEVKIELKASGTITIETGGKIDANGMGYAANSGPGAGGNPSFDSGGGAGGGYGGLGGGATGAAIGPDYGAYPAEPTFGSGGGNGDSGALVGGSGGGLIKVQANSLDLNGNIYANGNSGGSNSSGGGGGGSGGGIYLIISSGNVNANNVSVIGGNGGYRFTGGGGGGRVTIQASSISGSPLVSGGTKGVIGSDGNQGSFTSLLPYNTLGSLGGTGTGLRVGSPTGALNKWVSINWSASGLSATYKIGIQVRPADTWGSGDTGYVNPSDGTSSYYYLTSGNSGTIPLSSSFANTKTLETRLTFEGNGGNTPVLNNLAIVSAATDTISLDTQAPATFEVSTPANNTWQTSATPTLSWNASSDANGLAKYQLYIDGNLDTDSIGSGSTSQAVTNVLSAGNHTWYIKAIDNSGNITQSTSTWNIGYDATNPSLALDPGFTFSASDSDSDSVILTWGTYADDSGNGAPADFYNLERLKYSDYLLGSHTLTSDWSLGGDGAGSGYYGGYGNKTTTSQTDNVGANPEDIEESVRYVYRIKVTDDAGNVSAWLLSDEGMTADTQKPTNPSNVTAAACQANGTNCSTVDNPNPKTGYEMKLSWTASSDTGSGVTGYRIYRKAETNSTTPADFTVVGYLDVDPPGAPVSTVWYDNDANNDATFIDTINGVPGTVMKSAASNQLNDYTAYHYRISAIDAGGVQTEIVTLDAAPPYLANNTNYATATTKDVTAPSVPGSVTATAMGLDSSGDSQRVDLTWNISTDTRTVGRTPTGDGSGIAGYKIFRCNETSSDCSDDNNFSQVNASATNSYSEEELDQITEYKYKIIAVDQASSTTITDAANNNSARSTAATVTTASNTVPTVSASVTVNTKTGNPNTDIDVGHQNTVIFNGSYAQNCSGGIRCITGYEIYRSTTNYASGTQWLTDATLIADVAVSPIGDERTETYSYIDNDSTNDSTSPSIATSGSSSPVVTKAQTSSLSNATTYYYKVRAKDNTPASPDGGPFVSGLSAIVTGTNHSGWDTTADDTAPAAPQGTKVKKISENDTIVRVSVAWDTIADPTRNGSSDFAEYQVWKYETDDQSGTLEKISTKTNRGDNYYLDEIAQADKNKEYAYYVIAVDNAGTDYKYANNDIINNTSNESSYISPVTINPGAVDDDAPIISYTHQTPAVSNIGYSKTATSITVSWTTDEAADSRIDYGTTSSLGDSFGSSTLETSHTVTVPNISQNTLYYFVVKSTDAAGNLATQKDTGDIPFTITTNSDGTAPSNPTTTLGWDTSGKGTVLSSGNWYSYSAPYFEWSGATDVESDISGYYVYFGTSSSADPSGILQAQSSPNSYTASDLTSGQTYYLRVKTRNQVNLDASAVTLFEYKYDGANPSSAVTSPSSNAKLNALTSITGTSSDTSSNISSVTVSIKRNSDNFYLNSEDQFVDTGNTATWLSASGKGSWSYGTSGVTWDNGDYTIQSKAADNVGNSEGSPSSVSITIDKTAPTISRATLVSSTASTESKLKQGDTYRVYAYVSDNVGVLAVTANVAVSSNIITSSQTSVSLSSVSDTTVNDQTYNFRSDVLTANSSVSEGTKSYYINATDTAGNNASEFTSGSATVSNTSPGFSNIAVSTSPVKEGNSANITFTSSKELSSNPTVTVNGNNANYASNNGLDYTYSYTVVAGDNDGYAAIVVSGTDTFGNQSVDLSNTNTSALLVDKTAPDAPSADGTTSPVNGDNQTVSGSAEANSLVTISRGVSTWTQQLSGGGTVYSIVVPLDQNSTNNFGVTATDTAGNVSLSFSLPIVEDSVNPNGFDLVSPLNNTNLNTAYPTFRWQYQGDNIGGAGLSRYRLIIVKPDSTTLEYANISVPEGINEGDEVSKQVESGDALSSGAYSWKAIAVDNAGNYLETSTGTIDINIDLTVPQILISAPSYSDYIKGQQTVISGSASRSGATQSQVSSVQIKINNGSWAAVNSLTQNGQDQNIWDFSYTWTLPADGQYTLRARAVNEAGTTSNESDPVIVNIDNLTPSISTVPSSLDSTTTSTNIYWVSSEEVTSVIEYSLDDSFDSSVSDDSFATDHRIRLENLEMNTQTSSKTYNYRIKMTDKSGNLTTSEIYTFQPAQYDDKTPVISNIQSGPSANTVVISWTTDEASTSQVEYASSSSFENASTTNIDSKLNRDHSVIIQGLMSNSTYYFKVKSKDSNDNEETTSGSDNFTTTRVPAINGASITVEEIKSTNAIQIEWTSDEQTSSYVDYGLTTDYDKVAGKEELVNEHSVTIYDLEALSTYYFRVRGTNVQGNESTAVTSSGLFGTSFIDRVAPSISFQNQVLTTENTGVTVGVSDATIKWNTNEDADSIVDYKKQGDTEYQTLSGDPRLISNGHTVTIKSLIPSTTYAFKIRSADESGNEATSEEFSFATLSFGISGESVTTTSTSATVKWDTSAQADSSVEYKSGDINEDSQMAGDPTLASSHEIVLRSLRPDTAYIYKIRSVTSGKYVAETQFLTFRTKPYDASQFTITPNASSVAEQNITATSAKIVWNTAVATTSWLDYGTSSGAYNQSAGNNAFNTVHVVELLNLTPGNTYYYKVRGKDSNDIEYTSQEYSFTAVLLPELSNVKVNDLSHYSATITWDTNVDASSFVAYGKAASYGAGVGKNDFSRNHTTKIENLEDNTTYHYQVIVKDKLGNEVKSADATFTTPLDTAGPEVKEVKIDILPMGTDDETASAIMSWTTNKPATTQVEYDEGVVGGKYSKKSIEDPSLNTAHTVIIKDLNPSSTYHFRIVSKDKRENKTNSQDYTFVTPTKEKSILQLIIRSLEETFSWVKEMPRFFKGLGGRATGR